MLPKKVLFCTDFSDNSRPACKCAIEYSMAFGAELRILHVINTARIGYPSLTGEMPLDIRQSLNNIRESVDKGLGILAEECRKAGALVQTHFRTGIPGHEIVRFAAESSVELIVMGTHGRTGLSHLLMGSAAEKVVRAAMCPVLTVKATGDELNP
jgi:nucleotide-binding universal stress UspA family protein